MIMKHSGEDVVLMYDQGDARIDDQCWRARRFLMRNADIQAAWRFHNGTKHPYGYLLDRRHTYHPTNQPSLFKIYSELSRIPLPLDLTPGETSLLTALSLQEGLSAEERIPSFETVAKILHFSAGITKRIQYPPPWGEILFRAAACTGALYHIEIYLIAGDLPGLKAGVYHYDPSNSALKRLRSGDHRKYLIDVSGEEATIPHAPAVLVLTHIPWRNACKYQARAYRHAFWDSGTILSHALTLAAFEDLPAKVVVGFVDQAISKLLGLDEKREHPVAMVPIGFSDDRPTMTVLKMRALNYQVEPISDIEVDFPSIGEMHLASSLDTGEETKSWRESEVHFEGREPEGELVPLEPIPHIEEPQAPVESVILRRGSSRKFGRESISFAQLSTILLRTTKSTSVDFQLPEAGSLNQIYMIVNDVEDLTPGSYVFHQGKAALERLKSGNFRDQARHLALDQALGGDASVSFYFLSPLRTVLNALGNRGYRAAQLDASIIAGRMYLAAYALGLGATGLTFYDDAVTAFFSPHGEDKSVMFLISIGRPDKTTLTA
jgi:SagB-type dehydrogenase family enzyme